MRGQLNINDRLEHLVFPITIPSVHGMLDHQAGVIANTVSLVSCPFDWSVTKLLAHVTIAPKPANKPNVHCNKLTSSLVLPDNEFCQCTLYERESSPNSQIDLICVESLGYAVPLDIRCVFISFLKILYIVMTPVALSDML
jgi:hypothetical protein